MFMTTCHDQQLLQYLLFFAKIPTYLICTYPRRSTSSKYKHVFHFLIVLSFVDVLLIGKKHKQSQYEKMREKILHSS